MPLTDLRGNQQPMKGAIDSLYRYPLKGFTPERVEEAALTEGQYFPDDRLYAVENGPSGFDPAAPAFVPKQKFAVLARIPDVAKVRTRYDDGVLHAESEGRGGVVADLRDEAGRIAFAVWLETVLAPEDLGGPLKLVHAAGHRFTDHPQGHVSILNLASVVALGRKMGHDLDPLRFRANIHVSGLDPWVENDWQEGTRITLGGVELAMFKPIVRCMATHVNPETAVRDADVTEVLYSLEGHLFCGVYMQVRGDGVVRPGDLLEAFP